MTRYSIILFSVFSMLACGTADVGEGEEVGFGLNWLINSHQRGTVTCLDAGASTVEWRFDPGESDREPIIFTYDCVDGGQAEVIPSGQYSVDAKLRQPDGLVLSQCEPDVASTLTPSSNQVDQCIFWIP